MKTFFLLFLFQIGFISYSEAVTNVSFDTKNQIENLEQKSDENEDKKNRRIILLFSMLSLFAAISMVIVASFWGGLVKALIALGFGTLAIRKNNKDKVKSKALWASFIGVLVGLVTTGFLLYFKFNGRM